MEGQRPLKEAQQAAATAKNCLHERMAWASMPPLTLTQGALGECARASTRPRPPAPHDLPQALGRIRVHPAGVGKVF